MSFTQPAYELEIDRNVQVLKYNQNGNPYIAFQDTQANLASNEHVKKQVSFFCSRDELEESYGKPVIQYFNFLNFVIVSNVILFAFSLIGFIPHVKNASPKLSDSGFGFLNTSTISSLDLLFLSTFQPSTDGAWVSMMVLVTIFMFLIGPMYFYTSTLFFRDYVKNAEASTSADDDKISYDGLEKEVSFGFKQRMIISYAVFVLMCACPLAIMYAVLFQMLYRTIPDQYNSGLKSVGAFKEGVQLAVSLITSAIVPISNLIFDSIVRFLTDLEKHPTWSSYRRHRLLKIVLFRLVNVYGLFIFRFYADLPFYTCSSSRIAFQEATKSKSEGLSSSLPSSSYPVFHLFLRPSNPTPLSPSTSSLRHPDYVSSRPEFELTDEYFEIVYRQFIMYIGISVFPMITGTRPPLFLPFCMQPPPSSSSRQPSDRSLPSRHYAPHQHRRVANRQVSSHLPLQEASRDAGEDSIVKLENCLIGCRRLEDGPCCPSSSSSPLSAPSLPFPRASCGLAPHWAPTSAGPVHSTATARSRRQSPADPSSSKCNAVSEAPRFLTRRSGQTCCRYVELLDLQSWKSSPTQRANAVSFMKRASVGA
eukprot:766178-Hanusia_phi.AAC.2